VEVRVIYYDLSEWHGSSEEFNTSPHKGILAISISYPDSPYRHILSGRDYYFIKGNQYTHFDGDWKETRVINLLGYGKETTSLVPIGSLDLDYLRMGVWVDDRTMRIANRRILEREE